MNISSQISRRSLRFRGANQVGLYLSSPMKSRTDKCSSTQDRVRKVSFTKHSANQRPVPHIPQSRADQKGVRESSGRSVLIKNLQCNLSPEPGIHELARQAYRLNVSA